eukprot:TRINITY_DN7688_c0_g1_i1.p1 TRINITY_DN7688_c0_g1~~TRINITY_DN7688_c0_g1_i1.p1  ORF type:complete len:177 (+),score=33.64 TRINITY_DN7688_c0_g1_i1:51-581(+)
MSSFYIPPMNFGLVEEDLYRSGFPNELNFPFLERLKLKTIIFLGPDEPSGPLVNFVEDQGINLETILGGTDTPKNPWQPMTEEEVVKALSLLLNKEHYPLLIMCNLGRHHTGTICGCFRKLQRWNLTSILEEYRRFAGSKVRLMSEQFIELFDTDLVAIPSEAPSWLHLPIRGRAV